MVGMEAVKALAGYFPQRQAGLGLDGAALEVTAQDARCRARAWQVTQLFFPASVSHLRIMCRADGIFPRPLRCCAAHEWHVWCGRTGASVSSRHRSCRGRFCQRDSRNIDYCCRRARDGRLAVWIPRSGLLGGTRCRSPHPPPPFTHSAFPIESLRPRVSLADIRRGWK